MTFRQKIVLAALPFFIATSASASPVTVDYYVSEVEARGIGDSIVGNTLPYDLSFGEMSEGSSINATVAISETSNSLQYDVLTSLSVDNSTESFGCCGYAYNYTEFRFTPNVNSTYSISGNYNGTLTGGGGRFRLVSHLLDETNNEGVVLFVDDTVSESTSDFSQNMILGAVGDGNFSNQNEGSPNGTLIAGRTYEWLVSVVVNTDIGPNETFGLADSNGQYMLAIQAVPEPSTLLLSLLALGCRTRFVVRNVSVFR